MINLCCPQAIADAYFGGKARELGKLPTGELCFDEARAHLNRYTTTLHGINSAVIKLGKLTRACKVYRGISGGMLPEQFWTEDEAGVRGGCEFGFLSTTTDVEVATEYAGSGGKAGDGLVVCSASILIRRAPSARRWISTMACSLDTDGSTRAMSQ